MALKSKRPRKPRAAYGEPAASKKRMVERAAAAAGQSLSEFAEAALFSGCISCSTTTRRSCYRG